MRRQRYYLILETANKTTTNPRGVLKNYFRVRYSCRLSIVSREISLSLRITLSEKYYDYEEDSPYLYRPLRRNQCYGARRYVFCAY